MSLVALALCLTLLAAWEAPQALAQDGAPGTPCEGLPTRIHQDVQRAGRTSDSTLAAQTVRRIARTRQCIDDGALDAKGGRLADWLARREVYVLNLLGRTDEASDCVDTFLRERRQTADPALVARMYLWRTLFAVAQGDIESGLQAHRAALPLAGHLPITRRAHLMLDGAYLHWRADDVGHGLALVSQADSLLGLVPEAERNANFRHAEARLHYTRGDLLVQRDPVQALASYHAARTHRTRDYATEGRSLAEMEAAVGYAHTLMGNWGEASRFLRRAEGAAREHDHARGLVLALLRRGQLDLRRGLLPEAEDALREAEAVATRTGLHEFDVPVRVALGRVHEARAARRAAIAAYRRAAAAKVDPGDVRTQQQQAVARASLVRLTRDGGSWAEGWANALQLVFALALAAAAAGSTLVAWRLRRPAAPSDAAPSDAARRPAPDSSDDAPSGLESPNPDPPGTPSDLRFPWIELTEEHLAEHLLGPDMTNDDALAGAHDDDEAATPEEAVRARTEQRREAQRMATARARDARRRRSFRAALRLARWPHTRPDDHDIQGRLLMKLVERYFELYSRPDHLREPDHARALGQLVPSIFEATLQWLAGEDVWAWLDTMKAAREDLGDSPPDSEPFPS